MTKKLTLTKRKAISECKELWKAIEKSGLLKYGYLFSKEGRKWHGKNYRASCPLCEYAYQASGKKTTCSSCPLYKQYGKYCWDFNYKDSTPELFEAIRGLK